MSSSEGKTNLNVKFCPRSKWVAQDAKANPPPRSLKHPVGSVRYTETGSDTCTTPKECARVLQNVQRVHMEVDKLRDINYNFMIGGDGTIYEGRGWDTDVDRPVLMKHLEHDCVDIAYIGNAKDKSQKENGFPTEACEKAAFALATYGVQKQYIKKMFIYE